MHEFVASARSLLRERKVKAMDVCKRLLDFGFHAPTVYFPLVVPEALMMEPTETESKETWMLDAFADRAAPHTLTIRRAKEPDVPGTREATDGPAGAHRRGCTGHNHIICRPDEVKAAKEPLIATMLDCGSSPLRLPIRLRICSSRMGSRFSVGLERLGCSRGICCGVRRGC
jgi:glycine dehydrogenase subunit 2